MTLIGLNNVRYDHLKKKVFPSCPLDILHQILSYMLFFLMFFICCQTVGLVFELRRKWQILFVKRIRCPSKPWSQQDEAIVRTLVSVCPIHFSSFECN